MWVNEYLLEVHGEARGLEIIADIDHQYVFFSCHQNLHEVTPSLAYQRFPHFQGYDAFQMAMTSSNGQVMIRRRS